MERVGDILSKATLVQKASNAAIKPDAEKKFPCAALTASPQDPSHFTQKGQIVQLSDIRNQALDIGFVARLLTLATMPHSNPGDADNHTRINGDYKLVMRRGEDTKLPYGSYPRLLLAWICTEVVKQKEKNLELVLGESLSDFMRQLALLPTGGRWGTIPHLREQMKRLFNARISVSLVSRDKRKFFAISEEYDLWWDNKEPDQRTLWKSTVTISEKFYDEIRERPVPINMNILGALKRSPLGLDLYMFLTYRVSYMKKSTFIPLKGLHLQFGAEYKDIKNFQKKVRRELLKIKLAWPQLNYELKRGRIVIHPSQPSIPPADRHPVPQISA
jgi:Plasmid encoded RepA protein